MGSGFVLKFIVVVDDPPNAFPLLLCRCRKESYKKTQGNCITEYNQRGKDCEDFLTADSIDVAHCG
jgi:hypothetical protein